MLQVGAVTVHAFYISSFGTYSVQNVLVHLHMYICITRFEVVGVMSKRNWQLLAVAAFWSNQVSHWLL